MRDLLLSMRLVYQQRLLESGLPLTKQTVTLLPVHVFPSIAAEFNRKQLKGTSFAIVSDRTANPEVAADPLEMEAIDYFRAQPKAQERLVPFVSAAGRRYFHFSTPLRLEKHCLDCHGPLDKAPEAVRDHATTGHDYRLGELRGILSIKMPRGVYEDSMAAHWRHGILVHLLGFALAFLAVSLLIRHFLLARLDALREATTQLAAGNYRHRAEERGPAEIVELAAAFNAMAEAVLARDRKLREGQERLDGERAFLQTVVDGVVDPIMVIGPDCRVLMLNRAGKAIAQGTEGRRGRSIFCHCPQREESCEGETSSCPLGEVRRSGKVQTLPHQHYGDEGEKRIFETVASPVFDDRGVFQAIVVACRDITDRLKIEAKLEENESHLHYLVNYDPLTGLPNRLMLQDRLQHALARARRNGHQVALFYLDLDRFKNINDSLGFPVGDRILTGTAERLQAGVREADTIGRLGGDEFVIILEQVQHMQQVVLMAQRTLECLASTVAVEEYQLFVTASLGIAVFPGDGQQAEGLLHCAEAAMYRAKQEGGNTYHFYTPGMNARTRELLLLESSLRQALAREELVLFYQPLMAFDGQVIIGMEALLRWRHPDLGMIQPGDFIPLAEATGLILPIGRWVMRQACLQNKDWQARGLPPVRVAVNISARQFRDPELIQTIAGVLQETGLAPEYLELEITESSLMQEVDKAIEIMQELTRMGVQIAIDDFGTGYSSLSYLKRFPIRRLKIDRSFIRDVCAGSQDAAIVSAIIALAHSMHLEAFAEGVETAAQKRFLIDKGCWHGQGYLFSPPLGAADIEKLWQPRAPQAPREAEVV